MALLGLVLAITAVAAGKSSVVKAIECNGEHVVSFFDHPEDNRHTPQTRFYLLDDAQHRILSYNPDGGQRLDICSQMVTCDLSYGDSRILVSGKDAAGLTGVLEIDRIKGTVTDTRSNQSSRSLMMFTFEGVCRAAPLKRAAPPASPVF